MVDPDIWFGGPRGAEGAEEGEVWGGGVPLPTGSGEGDCSVSIHVT